MLSEGCIKKEELPDLSDFIDATLLLFVKEAVRLRASGVHMLPRYSVTHGFKYFPRSKFKMAARRLA